MKKFVFVIVLMLLLLVSCGKKDSDFVAEEENDPVSNIIEVDEKLIFIEVTLPSISFENMSETEILQLADTEGINEIIINPNKSVKMIMTEDKHNEFIFEKSKIIDEYIVEAMSDSYSIYSIEHNKDYTVFTITVDQVEYENGFEPLIVEPTLATMGIHYNLYVGIDQEDIIVKIQLKDHISNSIYFSSKYPE